MSSEEELVNAPFSLEAHESLNFVIGRIEQGDTLKISVERDGDKNMFEVTPSS